MAELEPLPTPYVFGEPGTSIVAFDGRATLSQGGESYECEAVVRQDFRPEPAIVAELRMPNPDSSRVRG
jgi:hypothetical protein